MCDMYQMLKCFFLIFLRNRKWTNLPRRRVVMTVYVGRAEDIVDHDEKKIELELVF